MEIVSSLIYLSLVLSFSLSFPLFKALPIFVYICIRSKVPCGWQTISLSHTVGDFDASFQSFYSRILDQSVRDMRQKSSYIGDILAPKDIILNSAIK